jgi:hypothetical protein
VLRDGLILTALFAPAVAWLLGMPGLLMILLYVLLMAVFIAAQIEVEA